MPGLANSNERLLERASKGDQRAFAAIFERYHQRLYRYCAAIVGNPDDAHDALQNTMVRVLAALPGESRKIELEPWLYRIAHNEAIEVVRRRRQQDDIDSIELVGAAGADTRLEGRERLRQLISDLRALPDRQRGALVMRELGGLSFEQIGEAFETSARVARQTVYEARVGLQDMEGGRAMLCDEVRQKLSDGDRRLIRRRDVRAHLRHCARCRDFEQAIPNRREDLGAIAPLSALAAAGVAKSLLGGTAANAVGQGAGAAGAGTIGQVIGGSVVAKTVATGAVVAAIGVGAADRAGLIHVLPGEGGSASAPARSSGGTPADPDATSTDPATSSHPGRAAGQAGADQSRRQAARSAKASPGSPGAARAQRRAGARGNPGTSPGGANARGAGAANAHGANPNANEHATTKSNNGRAAGNGRSEERVPQNGAAAAPEPKPHPEPAAKPASPPKEKPAAPAGPDKSVEETE